MLVERLKCRAPEEKYTRRLKWPEVKHDQGGGPIKD